MTGVQLALDAAPALSFVVWGEPVGQGWIQRSAHGRSYHGNDKVLQPWRAEVRKAALAAAGGVVLDGPVAVEITCTVTKSPTAAKQNRRWPHTRSSGDWDHLARAISDALSADARKKLAGVIRNDAQIVEGHVRKVFPGQHPLALAKPGAVIDLWAL